MQKYCFCPSQKLQPLLHQVYTLFTFFLHNSEWYTYTNGMLEQNSGGMVSWQLLEAKRHSESKHSLN